MKIDHLVINIDRKYQTEEGPIASIRNAGLPYDPKMGKGNRGFQASNLWIGREYMEMVSLQKEDGGGWKGEWVESYQKGHRGLVCLMLDVADLQEIYQIKSDRGLRITAPEYLSFKWGLGLFTRTMPWMNSYFPFFEGVPFQIGLQQMKDEQSEAEMRQYMAPNADENGISGIGQVTVKGRYTENDFHLLSAIFPEAEVGTNVIEVNLAEKQQKLIFKRSNNFTVQVSTHCENEKYSGKQVQIENTTISLGEQ